LNNQEYLRRCFEELTLEEREKVTAQLSQIDSTVLLQQEMLLQQHQVRSSSSYKPFVDFSMSGNAEDLKLGKELVANGTVGCLMIAGGQGTRLHFDGPKGMYPVSLINHKSLFQILSEKVIAAGKQVKRLLNLAIMTSPTNHEATVNFFEKNHLFGLKREQLSFFSQGELPFLSDKGELFLETPKKIAQGPDGNGGALHHFYESGIWEKWSHQGIKILNFILVDNPLADPFDYELIGHHHRKQNDIVVKCIARDNLDESLGVLAKRNGQVVVVEYSEMDDQMRYAKTSDNKAEYLCANLSLFSFGMDFIKDLAQSDFQMPLHKAFKAVKRYNPFTEPPQLENCKAWKFEKFIFDVFSQTQKISTLLYPREDCFAPLKNLNGENSIATVQAALLKRDQKTLSKLTGKPCDTSPLELPQEYYYPTPEFLSTLTPEQNGSL